jgi:hypothetical protein
LLWKRYLTDLSRKGIKVTEDEAFNPIHIGLLGADGVMFEADGLTNPVEELLWSSLHPYTSSLFPPEVAKMGLLCYNETTNSA